MCGIVGWVDSGSNHCPKSLIKAMADLVMHRGPDDEGFFFRPGVGIGHRRLSIIDLEHGHQPMTTGDGRYTIAYNGEIYNYIELKNALQSLGERFDTQSDTEVILRAFKRWGTGAFDKFRGMFAIAIWDDITRTLHLARDHIGIKPLYYVETNGELLFASEIKALFCHPEVQRRIDPEVLVAFLSFNNIFGNKSLWAGVKRCQPGERLAWREGKLSAFHFFDISSISVDPFEGGFDEAVRSYGEILASSVKEHMISDVQVGSYLSGGLDSGLIASIASKTTRTPFPVFTGYFKGHENGWYDERPEADAIAKNCGMKHCHAQISIDDFQDRFDKVAYHMDEPALGSGAIPHYVVAKLARSQVKVVLTGHGGDELFAGYPVFKAAFLRERGLENLSVLFSGGLDEKIRLMYFLIGGIFDPVIARGQFRMFSSSTLACIGTPLLMESIGSKGVRGILENLQPFSSKADLDGVIRWYLATYLPTLLVQEDKVSMAHGLEARVPMCYVPLMKLALSFSGKIKLHGGRLKAVPRKASSQILPQSILAAPKRGFPTPLVEWLAGGLGRSWSAGWMSGLPKPLEGLLDVKGVLKEFKTFSAIGCRLPNAYALAHRFVSLQMLLACAKGLNNVSCINSMPMDEKLANLPGTLVLRT